MPLIPNVSAAHQCYVYYGLARHTTYTYRLTAADGQGNQEVKTAQIRNSGGYQPVDLLPGAGDLRCMTIDFAYNREASLAIEISIFFRWYFILARSGGLDSKKAMATISIFLLAIGPVVLFSIRGAVYS